MLFLMHTGAVKDTVMSDEGEKVPAAGHRRAAGLGGSRYSRRWTSSPTKLHRVPQRESLPCCGRICGEHDAFCAVCGTRLSEEEPKEEKAPAAEPEIQPAAADAPRGGAGSRSGAARGISAAEKTNDVYDLRIAVLFCHLLGAGLVP